MKKENQELVMSIKETFGALLNNVIKAFQFDVVNNNIELSKLVTLWNRFVEDERDGNYYMFNFMNKGDLITLLKMKHFDAISLSTLIREFQANPAINTSYFFYNDDKGNIETLEKHNIIDYIVNDSYDIMKCVLRGAFVDEYKWFYQKYIYDNTLDD